MTVSGVTLAQLHETLRFAVAEIPYYRERADSYGAPVETLDALQRLPFVTPEAFAADPRAFSSGVSWPEGTTFSSATTGDIGRSRWRSFDELRAIRSFQEQVGLEPATGVTLWIHAFDQGPPLLVPGSDNVICVPFLVPWHFTYIRRLLEDGWEGPTGHRRVERLVGFSPALRILTVYLEERGVVLEDFKIQSLEGFGSIQPWIWRRRLARSWGAPYQDLYGLSEVVGSEARSCPVCGAYHFFQPIIAEVVDLVSGVQIREGLGELILTELTPYARLQLLIRYRTGDLVEIAPRCMVSPFGIRFRGRLQHSLVIERDEAAPVAFGSLQIGEICAELPDVADEPVSWADWAADVGPPRFHLAREAITVRVAVELRYDPALHQERAASVRETLRRAMVRSIRSLDAGLEAGDLELDLTTVNRGTLESITKL